ncbi:hypothetical protein ACI2LJ_35970 [Streptomyces sp. NPDC088090]|uniref:hypothetical protein n=1 Tax=Streptomyces sp. NPDC088090 TaxID=3365822 RepID=UPI00384C22AC
MDPAVIAALVASPTALIAAGAAYAAGRRQALGALRGPVDAVRRQHQRDAYAGLLDAANNLVDNTDWTTCLGQAQGEALASGDPSTLEALEQRARVIRNQAAISHLKAVKKTAAVVTLEGPEHVALQAARIRAAAKGVAMAARLATLPPRTGAQINDRTPSEVQATQSFIQSFIVMARDHLNATDA